MQQATQLLSDLFIILLVLFMFVVALGLGVLAYQVQDRVNLSGKQLIKTEGTLKLTEKDLGYFSGGYWQLYGENEKLKQDLANLQSRHDALYTDFARIHREMLLERWFAFLGKTKFRSRSDIGALLLCPMLWFLDYPDSIYRFDEPDPKTDGTKGVSVYVSCVVLGISQSKGEVPLFLFESIPPSDKLTTEKIDQTKDRALSSNVLKFCITNGDEFVLVNLVTGGLFSAQSHHFSVKNIKDHWLYVQQELHSGAFPF